MIPKKPSKWKIVKMHEKVFFGRSVKTDYMTKIIFPRSFHKKLYIHPANTRITNLYFSISVFGSFFGFLFLLYVDV